MDLPICSFKDCRYNFDCNCMDKSRKQKCEINDMKSLLEKSAEVIEILHGKETELTKHIRTYV